MMEHRDYLMKQFEQLAIVLRSLLSKNTAAPETRPTVSQELSEQLGYNLDQLRTIEEDRWIDTLLAIPSLNTPNLKLLADLLSALGTADPAWNPKSLLIYRHLERSEKTYSLERNAKIDKIESLPGGDS